MSGDNNATTQHSHKKKMWPVQIPVAAYQAFTQTDNMAKQAMT